MRTLLSGFNLADVVVTVDAMHTQTDTAKLIVDAGGDYVFTVKGNQPTLYAACKALPWLDVPARSATSKGHGRRVTRTVKAFISGVDTKVDGLSAEVRAHPAVMDAYLGSHAAH